MLDEFTARGGKVTYGALEQKDLGKLTDSHEATVVATGKGGLQDLFDRVEEHCPYSVPQRLLCSGLYEGFNFQEMTGVTVHVAPGVGEMQQRLYGTFERAAASPSMARALIKTWLQIDVRDVLESVHVPTLVLHVEGEHVIPVEAGRLLAGGRPRLNRRGEFRATRPRRWTWCSCRR